MFMYIHFHDSLIYAKNKLDQITNEARGSRFWCDNKLLYCDKTIPVSTHFEIVSNIL